MTTERERERERKKRLQRDAKLTQRIITTTKRPHKGHKEQLNDTKQLFQSEVL